MSIYLNCETCRGRGSFKCTNCKCPTCDSIGRIVQRCGQCNGTALVTCQHCFGKGEVLRKKGWFSDKYDRCSRCNGSRQERCRTCKQGLIEVTCTVCKGSGAASSCSRCRGQGAVPCQQCSGSGELRPNWSVARIREEIAERRARIRENEAIIREQEAARMDYPGEYQYKGIEYPQAEIRVLKSWL
jgi:DnaJ-class molecular chaperone